MIRRYSEEKHQSLWGAVCDYMRQAGCPINEQEAVPEFVRISVPGDFSVRREFQCCNGTRFVVLTDKSGNGVWAIHDVSVIAMEEDDE